MKDEDRVVELEERIARLEQGDPRQQRGTARATAETAFWAIVHNVFPEDARRHLKTAGREQLLAARVYLDTWIARLEHPGETPDAPAPQHENIEVK